MTNDREEINHETTHKPFHHHIEIALAGGNLSAAVTHTLIDIQDTMPFELSASAPESSLESPLLLAGETKTVTKTKTKTNTTTTTTSTSDDSDSESSDSWRLRVSRRFIRRLLIEKKKRRKGVDGNQQFK